MHKVESFPTGAIYGIYAETTTRRTNSKKKKLKILYRYQRSPQKKITIPIGRQKVPFRLGLSLERRERAVTTTTGVYV